MVPYDTLAMQSLKPFTMGQDAFSFAHSRINSTRPPQLIRFQKDSVIRKGGCIQCPGKLQSGVLEDEAYMSSIVSLAMQLKVSYHAVPLEKWNFDISWSSGDCFPLMPYGNENNLHPECEDWYAILYVNSKPHGMELWVKSLHHCADELISEDQDYSSMKQTHSLVVTAQAFVERHGARGAFVKETQNENGCEITECADMTVAQKVVFALGWGPCPFYRRPG